MLNHNVLAPIRNARRPIRIDELKPTKPKSLFFMIMLGLAQLSLFVALMGPVVVSMAIKAETIANTSASVTSTVGSVLGAGAFAALIGNVLFGRLSDRTRTRFGRRRPWIIGGTLLLSLGLYIVSIAPTATVMLIGWFVAQVGANAAFSPFIATLADQLPAKQYASASAMIGIMQSVGIMVASWIATLFSEHMLALFMIPALIGTVGMVTYALILPDPEISTPPPPWNTKEFLTSFWINPIQHPDFAYAWLSRFLINMAVVAFTTFRLPYLIDHLDVKEGAVDVVFISILLHTAIVIVSGAIAGRISDRTGKRKYLVCTSIIFFAIGTYMLTHITTVWQFYLVDVLIGIGAGIYLSVDMALVLEVLPNPEDNAKDLGVFNIANVLPQSLAPFLGAFLLTVQSTPDQPNYILLIAVSAGLNFIGGLLILPIKKVK